ncbi:MAG: hypothetical protein JSW61_01105 [Candidatus Thorarchaeota archaeon]|nr:MAG: hypothetical protein JSW61_01105 [Candidatus Thorarchaeota archaeon]
MKMVSSEGHILLRRPAIPRTWDPISRPHVAVVVQADDGLKVRYYLSTVAEDKTGRRMLDVSNLDTLPEGTLVEVRFDATKANLYKLERIDGVTCWRWMARSRGLQGFDYPAEIDWHDHVELRDLPVVNGVFA